MDENNQNTEELVTNETKEDFNMKSSTGLDNNLAALLCYLGAFITGIIFYFIEKNSKYVKFHAMQSTILFGGLFVINLISSFIPFIGGLISLLVTLGGFILWIVMMIKAYQGERFKLPYIGDYAEKIVLENKF